jgi:hypothetical protein
MRAAQNQLLLAAIDRAFFPSFHLGAHMGEVVQFISKRNLERARLIQEARAIYESVFPTEKSAAGEQRCTRE